MNTLALRWLVVCGMLSLLGGCGGGPSGTPAADNSSPASSDVIIPNLIGLPESTARSTIIGMGLAIGSEKAGISKTVALGSVMSQDPAPGTTVLTGSSINLLISAPFAPIPAAMATARAEHAAARLPDNRVLLTGGYDAARTVQTSAEVFDPTNNTFGILNAKMTTPRRSHTATALPDGSILLTGGRGADGLPLDSAELFDPVHSTFIALPATMTTPRAGHTAVLLTDGTVLLVGGVQREDPSGTSTTEVALDSAELFDPKSKTFSALPSHMTVARAYAAGALLPTGQVLIMGGTSDFTESLDSAEVYNPNDKSFSTLPASLTIARALFTATKLPSGSILLTGGTPKPGFILGDGEIYNPSATFTKLPFTMTAYRFGHTATLLSNGLVLLTGGFSLDSAKKPNVASTAELYNPQ